MTWLKKNWYYPVLVLFVVGFVWFAVTAPKPSDKVMGYLGALFFLLAMASVRALAYMLDQEVARCVALETVKIEGRTVDCIRFRYATANLRMLLFLCIAGLPMVLAVCYASSFGGIKADFVLAVIPIIIISLTVAILKRPGLRITPNGLLVRGRLKSSQNSYYSEQVFVPWDEIAGFDMEFVVLSILTSNGHASKKKMVPGAFIGVKIKDFRLVPASPKVKESLRVSQETYGYDILIPVATLQKEQEMNSHYYLVPSPPVVLQVLRYYTETSGARSDIGTRLGYTDLDRMFGSALRGNVKDQTTGELAKMYQEKVRASQGVRL